MYVHQIISNLRKGSPRSFPGLAASFPVRSGGSGLITRFPREATVAEGEISTDEQVAQLVRRCLEKGKQCRDRRPRCFSAEDERWV